MEKEHIRRVIIVGAGVTGLTLANALEQAEIDFVLLERRSEVDPRHGQSIAAEPNGSRILDQLGILEKWRPLAQPIQWWHERDTKGEILFRTDGIQLGGLARTGYELGFGDRGDYLEIIGANIKDQSKIHLNMSITSVEESDSEVTVTCEDGSVYHGDILVGADGVRSKVREEMWRLASSMHKDLVEHDRKALFAEYTCLFGITKTPAGPSPGDCDYRYDKGRSSLIFAGPHGKTYYFIFEELDKVHRGNDIPKFTKEDAVKYARKHLTMKIRPDLTFADYWKEADNQNLVSVEEGVFKLWTYGRIACVGDAAHKMTPNIGTGGNAGIESAAALANVIKLISDQSKGKLLTREAVEKSLKSYQNRRMKRANFMVKGAGEITRMQAGKTASHRFSAMMARVMPGDFVANFLSDYFCDSVMLDYLPPPKASLEVLQPFNSSQGASQKEKRMQRAFLALPFLGIFFFIKTILAPATVIPFMMPFFHAKQIIWEGGSAPIRTQFYGIKQIDDLWAPFNTFFTPTIYGYDPISRAQTMTFLTDLGVIVAIWAFESVRRANILTFARLPVLFMLLGQLRGIGVLSPLYYFLYYTCTPIEKFKSSDMRLGRRNFAVVLLPVLLLMFYGPGFAMFNWPTLAGREAWLFFWQMFPVWISLSTFVLSYVVPDTTVSDRFTVPDRDLPAIRYTICILSALSAAVWIWTCLTKAPQLNVFALLLPERLPNQSTDFVSFAREFLRVDALSLYGNTFLWLAYLFWDLKYAGMVETSWIRLGLYLTLSTIVLGPGATAGLGWLWRENVLATRRHKDAITVDNLRRKSGLVSEVGMKASG
ncbi:FAD/NAD(P)-binding domain-containing protein [Tothia fuscella]|uniref:FAD/NAD(P)-binding domain-containing protein n=1 Tax=Tothia fuscella TaxID=1048955 RepID=A0A9P4NFN1_9PEZI|nr:FAD/NAD(P)-binding domain-containing protein [Tothia fuscella]